MGILKYVGIGIFTICLIASIVCFTLLALCHYEVLGKHCKTCPERTKRSLTLKNLTRNKRVKGVGFDGCTSDKLSSMIGYGTTGGFTSMMNTIQGFCWGLKKWITRVANTNNPEDESCRKEDDNGDGTIQHNL